MSNDDIPQGYERNTPDQLAIIRRVAEAALKAGGDDVCGVAVVLVLRDPRLSVIAAYGSRPVDMDEAALAFTRLQQAGPETLRLTIDRSLKGHGDTEVRSDNEPEVKA